ncbi:MAG: hypothetical protein H6883_09080 [Rhodobiaceae bacterium]|nr:hypothetical protein [Rhodobiaceae bacterium]MCC0056278.1 hypothetical protein [Rhodobiaceae bacterium]
MALRAFIAIGMLAAVLSSGGCAAGVAAGAVAGTAAVVKTTARAGRGAVRVTARAGKGAVKILRREEDVDAQPSGSN